MNFLYPLGLLGLIGIPIVIIIYILRNKFNEQTVPSTYLWILSEKFFKRRNPLSGLTGIISLILQILTIAVISLAIARPIITIPNSAGEYCFILDGSGSMNMESGLSTRFEVAKDKIESKIRSASDGSTYTLIFLSGETTVTYERLQDKTLAIDMLNDLKCSDGTVQPAQALAYAQKYFEENPSFSVSFYTDKAYQKHENVELVNVSGKKDVNYALSDVTGTFLGGKLTVTGNVTSFTTDASLKVELFINDRSKAVESTTVSVKAGETVPVTLSHKISDYDSFRIAIANDDCLAADNEVIRYNLNGESSYNIQIVSETPFFLEAVLDVLTDCKVDTVTPAEYTGKGDYGLYIFHSYTPEKLPDAAVWLIHSNQSVDNSGFGIRGTIELDTPGELVKSVSTASTARKMLEGIDGRNIFISEYVKYSGMYTKFTTLFSYGSNPLILAGVNGMGNREVVFGFDLHKADFSLSSDFAPLMGNLLRYSCPDVVDSTNHICGKDVDINIMPNAKNIKVIAPDGETVYIDASTDVSVLHLNQVGTYTIKMNIFEEEKTYRFFASAPAEESNPTGTEESFALVGKQAFDRTDGTYDPIVILFICLVILFTADWMVFCYEKYQLR